MIFFNLLNKKAAYFVFILLFFIFSIPLLNYFNNRNGNFSFKKITSNLPYESRWETLPNEQIDSKSLSLVLTQKFHYLGKGAQCFAFVSDDDQYAIKFFKFQHLGRKQWLDSLPLPGFLDGVREGKQVLREKKLFDLFSSYKLAYSKVAKETGLLFLHLNKTTFLNQNVTVVDKLGKEYFIDLDQVEFILQKKANLLYPSLEKLLVKNKKELAWKSIKSVLDCIYCRMSKGIDDTDSAFAQNYGLVDLEAVQFDVGCLVENADLLDVDKFSEKFYQTTIDLEEWLREKDKDLLGLFYEYRQQLMLTVKS